MTESRNESLNEKRYRRLRVLGAAPFNSKQLATGNLLRFQNLDDFIDNDLYHHDSRGEAKEDTLIIDLDKLGWERIKKAASESTWMPADYMANDWEYDVCEYLRNGYPNPTTTRTPIRFNITAISDSLVLSEHQNGKYCYADDFTDTENNAQIALLKELIEAKDQDLKLTKDLNVQLTEQLNQLTLKNNALLVTNANETKSNVNTFASTLLIESCVADAFNAGHEQGRTNPKQHDAGLDTAVMLREQYITGVRQLLVEYTNNLAPELITEIEKLRDGIKAITKIQSSAFSNFSETQVLALSPMKLIEHCNQLLEK